MEYSGIRRHDTMHPVKPLLRFAGVLGLPVLALCQTAVPVPSDPLELVNGDIHALEAPEARQAAIDLLRRSRTNQTLRGAGHGYDLKVTFTVDSGGQTLYDGAWVMEDIFLGRLGLRWTAKAAAGYTATQILANGLNFGEGTGAVPLRLEEARAALFGAVTSNPDGLTFRSAMATYNGLPVTCFLLEGPERVPTAGSGRRWDEAEDCIDPQSGILQGAFADPRPLLRLRLYGRDQAGQSGGASKNHHARSG
jgi:hypothetical protein